MLFAALQMLTLATLGLQTPGNINPDFLPPVSRRIAYPPQLSVRVCNRNEELFADRDPTLQQETTPLQQGFHRQPYNLVKRYHIIGLHNLDAGSILHRGHTHTGSEPKVTPPAFGYIVFLAFNTDL